MNGINKQKFLAELGKLLTFMYEEDRQTALAMYVKMFEDTEDEQALIQALVSPTRQAVIVARAYNAKMRKLQVEAQSREVAAERVEEEATPDFILAINQVYQDAVHVKSVGTAPLENQYSLFEEDMFPEDAEDEEPVGEAEDEEPVGAAEDEEPVREAEDEESVGEAEDEEPIEEDEAEEMEEALAEAAEDEAEADAGEDEASAGPAAIEEPAEEPESSEAPAVDEAAEAAAVAAPLFALADAGEEAVPDKDAVDAFLEDFSLDEELLPLDAEEEGPAVDEAEPEMDRIPEPETADEEEAEEISAEPDSRGTVRKAKPLLLILYILLAVPITLACVILLLIPTLLFLALAVAAIAAGAALLVAAFSGFPVLADILIVLGAALITLAIGLLFLWVFIWFIGSVIVGLIRGVVSLGSRWCYKEVSA